MYCGTTIAIILIFGNARLWKSYGGDSVRAALVVGESTLPEEGELISDALKYLKGEPLTDGKFTSARAHVRKVINRNFQLAENALQAGAKFVVFPEANPAITPYEENFSIEQDYALVRPTGGGFSVVTDPMGRTTAFQNTSLPGEHVLLADVFTNGVTTVYSVIGDVFSWLCIVGFMMMLMVTFIQSRL